MMLCLIVARLADFWLMPNVFSSLFYGYAEDNVDLLVGSGIVPALVKHLQEPQWPNEDVIGFDEFVTHSRPLEHEVEKGSAFTIGLLAIKVLILLNIFVIYLLIHRCASIGLLI